MAMPSTESSSLGRLNPKSRASELTDPMRRSFAANPFAKPSFIPNPNPRQTPPDFPRREGAAGSFFRDLDDKENGKDPILKPWKARSPAVSSKGAKNFMSPTISASSKVTASPRKKVLVDRNEPARASAPSTATKSPIKKVTFTEPLRYSCDMKAEGGVGQKMFEALSSLDDGVPKEELHNVASSLSCEELCDEPDYDMNVNSDSENEDESSFATVVDEPDCVNLDPSFKLSPTPITPLPVSSGSAILAPLDADPLMPPYDPKTNYLSPRPQFLHYRPKQRIELNDSFMSGSFSDTKVAEDTQSEGSQKESEDVSSDERIEEEQSPARTLFAGETVRAKEKAKPRLFMRWKAAIALLLVLSVALISISGTNTPVMDGTVFQDAYQVYESSEFSEFAQAHFDWFSEFAKANFDGLSWNFQTWFTKSLSSISEWISNIQGAPGLGHLHYCNLSVLHEYNAVDQGPMFGRGEKDTGEAPQVHLPVLNDEDSATATVTETHQGIVEGVSANHYDSSYEGEVQQDLEVITAFEQASDDAPEFDEATEGQSANVIDLDQAWQLAEVSEPIHSDVNMDLKVQSSLDSEGADIHIEVSNAGNNIEARQPQEDNGHSNLGLQDQPGLDSEGADIHIEVSNAGNNIEAKQPQEDNAHSNGGLQDQPGLDSEGAETLTEAYGDNDRKLTEAKGEYISMDAATEGNEQRLRTFDLQSRMVLYLLLCGGAILIGGATINWSRKCKSRSPRINTSSVEQPMFAKAIRANSLLTHKQEQSYLDKSSLRNSPTEIDMHGESCPSEMSSIQKVSSSYRQRLMKEFNEVQSHEKKAKKRRESLASSSDYSMGSPSYGSFTTYERIQLKNGHGNGEMITPVRRSSRIRSQATSPL